MIKSNNCLKEWKMTKFERNLLSDFGLKELKVYQNFTPKRQTLYQQSGCARRLRHQSPISPSEYYNTRRRKFKDEHVDIQAIKKKVDNFIALKRLPSIEYDFQVKELPNEAEYEAKFEALWARPEFLAQIKGA